MSLPHRLLVAVLCCLAVVWAMGPESRLVIVLALLLFGPGYLLGQALSLEFPPLPFVRPTFYMSLSISLLVLLYEWSTALGVVLSFPVLAGLALACATAVVWRVWHTLARCPPSLFTSSAYTRLASTWGVLLAVFLATLWTRFVHIQNLALPPWVDPVHHVLMIRVAIEQGQAPYSLRPYLPLDNLPYHWGYHVVLAATMQLAGSALVKSVFWVGQIFSALHVLSCAALASYMWRRPLAGIAAGVVVGLVSIMPAYFLSWGRYTMLVGLLVLPALAIGWHSWLRTSRPAWLLVAVILLAGLSMTHFLVLLLALCLLTALSLIYLLRVSSWSEVRSFGWHASGGAVLALLLAAPWLWVIGRRLLLPAIDKPQQLTSGGDYVAMHEGLLWAGPNRLLLVLAMLALLWAFWRRSRVALAYAWWVVLLVVLANPWTAGYLLPVVGGVLLAGGVVQRRWYMVLVGGALLLVNPKLVTIPYQWLITNDMVVLSLFVPISLLIGGLVHLLSTYLEQLHPPQWRAVARAGLIAALVAFAIWGRMGTWNLFDVVNPDTILATSADVDAIAWVAEHTPDTARFLINAAPWYHDADRGVDGGYWLLTLTGRWISTPPALFTYGPPDYVQSVQAVSRQVTAFQAGQEAQIHRLIEQEAITHIYLSSWGGPLTTEIFGDTTAYEQIYNHEGVVIFAVRGAGSPHENGLRKGTSSPLAPAELPEVEGKRIMGQVNTR